MCPYLARSAVGGAGELSGGASASRVAQEVFAMTAGQCGQDVGMGKYGMDSW